MEGGGEVRMSHVYFDNRWSMRKRQRPSDWVIIGFSTAYHSPVDFYYRISFFGLQATFWFKKND